MGGFGFSLPSWIPKVGGKRFSIPMMAEGGIIIQPTMAMVGEAGYPEAVIPLPKLQPMLDSAVRSAFAERKTNLTGGDSTSIHIDSLLVPLDDLRQLRELEDFVNFLSVRTRMNVGIGA